MKVRSEFVCQQCGYKSSYFLGKCPQCGEWNSLVETSVLPEVSSIKYQVSSIEENLVRLSAVKSQKTSRISSGFSEFDRVLGGGIVPGSVVLISGDPGIGKSTLLLQCAVRIAEGIEGTEGKEGKKKKPSQPSVPSQPTRPSVLYVTGEESNQQVKIRADRLVGKGDGRIVGNEKPTSPRTREPKNLPDNLYILPQTKVEIIIAACEKLVPSLLIIDSIQTLTTDKLSGSAGSVGQVRECANLIAAYAKSNHIPTIIVGHVTKEGNIAGPKVLEHIVDAVLNIEGDNLHNFRILRSVKNRYGSTFEVGVFEMTDGGMFEVSNPSQIFLAQRIAQRAGSVVASTLTGERSILAEIQALCTSTIYGLPVRRVIGLDFNRVQIVIAALTRAANLQLGNSDIYVNVAGGLRVIEPAADLPCALAIVSATLDKPLRSGVCAFGEVGLLGELRPVSLPKNRINEAKRLGFSDVVTAERFKTLEEAIGYAIHGE